MKKLLVLLLVMAPVSGFAATLADVNYEKKNCKGTFTYSGPDENNSYTWDCETLPATVNTGGTKPVVKAKTIR